MNVPSEKLLLRIPEAAAILGLGRSTVYALIGSGALPVVRVGRSVRIPMSGLQTWIETQTASLPVAG